MRRLRSRSTKTASSDRAGFWRLAPWLVAGGQAACGLFIALSWFPIGDLGVESDFFAELGPAAQALARGEISVHNHPYKGPLYGLILAALHGLLKPLGFGWYRSAQILSLLSTAGAMLLVYGLVRALGGRRAGLAAMILTGAVCEVFIQAHKASSDPLFLLLSLSVAAAILVPQRVDRRLWLLAGILTGGAFLTRYIGAVLLIWLSWQAFINGGAWPQRWRRVGLALAGWLLVSGPWFAISWLQTGSLLVTRNLENVARVFEPAIGSEAARTATSVLALVAHDPPRVLGSYLGRLPHTLGQDAVNLVGRPMALFVLLGMLALVVRVRDGRPWRWLLAGGLYLLAVSWVFYLPRFDLPLVPLYALLVAVALFVGPRPGGPVWDRRLTAFWAWRRYLPAWLVVAGLVAFHANQSVKAVRFYRAWQPYHLQGVIGHLAGQAAGRPPAERPALLARTAHAAFHAGLPYRPYPRHDLGAEEFLLTARERGADLVLVGAVERRLAGHYRFLDDLAGYAGATRRYDDGINTVLALDPAVADFGRDLTATAMADSVAARLESADPRTALPLGDDLVQRHFRAGRYEAARILGAELLARLQALPGCDADLVARLRRDQELLARIIAERSPAALEPPPPERP